MTVPLLDLGAQHAALREEVLEATRKVIESQRFIGGPEVQSFEQEVEAFLGGGLAIGCASGSDALLLALWALDIGPGDEVVTTPFTFFATAGAISRLGAKPVFADIEEGSFNLCAEAAGRALSGASKAILPVDLFGVPADWDALRALAEAQDLLLVEDAAQAIGASWNGKAAGLLGDLGCFSFFPSKNLGAWGDGGLVTTSDPELAARVARLRAHGSHPRKYLHATIGCNSRLDALQAAVLRVKLRHLSGWTEARAERVQGYKDRVDAAGLSELVRFQTIPRGARPAFHQCVVRIPHRDTVAAALKEEDIGHAIYYPLPLHLQACYSSLGYREGDLPVAEQACREVLALPLFPELKPAQQDRVIDALGRSLRSASL